MKSLKIKPPQYAFGFFLIFLSLHFIFSQIKNLIYPHPILGILIFCLGLSLMLWAWSLFQKVKTVICPTDTPKILVNEGPFQISRNPMYLGITLILLGIWLLFGGVFLFLAPVAFFLTVNFIHIPFEENNLKKVFQKEYLDYKKRVRRWI